MSYHTPERLDRALFSAEKERDRVQDLHDEAVVLYESALSAAVERYAEEMEGRAPLKLAEYLAKRDRTRKGTELKAAYDNMRKAKRMLRTRLRWADRLKRMYFDSKRI